jgi:hypothetical protein
MPPRRYVGYDFHSVFERHHRFFGWTALILTCERSLSLQEF